MLTTYRSVTRRRALSHVCAVLLSGFFASGFFTSAAAQSSQSKDSGRRLLKPNITQCIGCHGIPGYHASFPEVYRVPMISGQNPTYIENALKSYRSGERTHPSMTAIAKSLTDPEISALAHYYSQYHP